MKEPKKVNLANIPTPIVKSHFNGCSFLVKRDDYTGVEYSGNKIRKLEYLLFDAKKKKSKYIFTSGGDQSNHARATCIAASFLGLKTKLFLWGNSNQKGDGNLFLDKLTGAEISFMSIKEYKNVNEIMLEESKKKKYKEAYIIPSGGSSTLGIWGYVNFVKELSAQINMKKIKGIFLTAGTGGTAAGILIGLKLLGLNKKVFATNVVYGKDESIEKIVDLSDQCIKDFKIKIKVNFKNLEILDGYSEEGYKNITPEKINVIKNYFKESGILLDPTYTGKAFFAYNELLLSGRKKSDILFLHTGGLFGAFAKRKNYLD